MGMSQELFVALRQERQPLPPETLGIARDAGLDGCEPFFQSAGEVNGVGEALRRHGLEMRSCGTTARLHDEHAPAAIETILSLGRAAQVWGVTRISVALEPVRRDLPIEKGEYELRRQSQALAMLGERLAQAGLALVYAPQAYELRSKAREFERMLQTTSPEAVSLALDWDWLYRETGHNAAVLQDIALRYAARLTTLYLRLPSPAELEAPLNRLAQALREKELHPWIVLDGALASATPELAQTLRQARAAAAALFGSGGSQGASVRTVT